MAVSKFVVHVITTIDRGGAESQLLLLAREQVKSGMNVSVIDLKGQSELKSDFANYGVILFHDLLAKSFIIQAIKLRKILGHFPANTVLHAHLPQAELVCMLAKRKTNPLIITRHFGGKFKPNSKLRISSFLGVMASLRASKIIAISESVKNVLIRNREVFRPNDIEVIYYGFDRNQFRNQISEIRSGALEFPISLGTVSRLSPEKNVDLIIKAYAHLREELDLSNLRIVGVGPLEKDLKSLCLELGIADRVEFLGSSKEIANFMNSLDVFILASSFEGFGMVLVEAMAVGKRIVASRNTAIEEIIGHTACGTLFETRDLKDLTLSIKRVLVIDHETISTAQIDRLHDFEIGHTAKKIQELYGKVSQPL